MESSGEGGVDRISTLPDEIIHLILARLRSPNEVRKVSILSKRWTHIVRSYPILEFDGRQFHGSNSSAAEFEKLSKGIVSMEAVRINIMQYSKTQSDALDRILDSAAKFSPREIDITTWSSRYSIRFLPPYSKQFLRLKVLKLKGCQFDVHEDIVTNFSSLRVLCLLEVRIRDARILNSMITSASFLESLTLNQIRGVPELQVQLNHPNLKFLEVRLQLMESFEITGTHSLEEIRLDLVKNELPISLPPNLKVLHIGSAGKLGAEVVHRIISELPSLELLELDNYHRRDQLKIVNNYKLREIRLWGMSCDIEVEVLNLQKLELGERTLHFPPRHHHHHVFPITHQNLPSLSGSSSMLNQTTEQMKRSKIDQGADDRLSTLPDKIIHQILARLQSSRKVAQVNLLSKRWTDLVRSYPVLEFEENYYSHLKEQVQERLAKATLEKFSPGQGNISMAAVRVKVELTSDFISDFLDSVLELAAKSSPHEIDIKFGCHAGYSPGYGYFPCGISYNIPESFFISSEPNSKQFHRLKVLKLTDCDFEHFKDNRDNNHNPFSSLGRSLKVLCLVRVKFPDSRILNSLIAAASLLETLTLHGICGIDQLQIRNHQNLKAVYVPNLTSKGGIEITGAPSLEKVCIFYSAKGLRISLTPNLKDLTIQGGTELKAEFISKLIEELPSLELLTLHDVVSQRRISTIFCSDGRRKVFIDNHQR